MVDSRRAQQPLIQFGPEICRNLDEAVSREWLETNGLGGFASSTIIGLNTRRYHGLLFAATRPPTGRTLLLSKLEETLIVDGERFDLSTNQYHSAIHPEGYRFQTGFRLDPYPIFTSSVDGIWIEKHVLMIHGKNTVLIESFIAPSKHNIRLEIRPLIAFRDYHALTHENPDLNPALDSKPGIIRIRPYSDLPSLFIGHNAAAIEATGFWYRSFEYQVERERGLDFQEDLFNPFLMTFDLNHDHAAIVIASDDPRDCELPSKLVKPELTRHTSRHPQSLQTTLETAADQF